MGDPQPLHIVRAGLPESIDDISPHRYHFFRSAVLPAVFVAAPHVPVAVELVQEADERRFAEGLGVLREAVDILIVFPIEHIVEAFVPIRPRLATIVGVGRRPEKFPGEMGDNTPRVQLLAGLERKFIIPGREPNYRAYFLPDDRFKVIDLSLITGGECFVPIFRVKPYNTALPFSFLHDGLVLFIYTPESKQQRTEKEWIDIDSDIHNLFFDYSGL